MENTFKMTNEEQKIMDMMSQRNTYQEEKKTQTRPPSQKQIDAIANLAKQKNITIDESRTTTATLASAYIKELISLSSHIAASVKQIEKIASLCEELKITPPNTDKLTGGMNGSASKLIQMLKDKVDLLPSVPSEKQSDFILQIVLCPDCEEVTPQTMSKQEATDYISKYRDTYYSWIKNRLSTDQIARIKQLCQMMQTPFELKGIIQLNPEQASEYIEQLQHELQVKEWNISTLEPEDNSRKIASYDTVREELLSFCSKAYANMGMELETTWFEENIGSSNIVFSELKDLIDLSRIWGFDAENALEKISFFTVEQKASLLA